jgi:hypothetical protein
MDWPVPGTITREPLAVVVQLDSLTQGPAKENVPSYDDGPHPEPEPEPVLRDDGGPLSPRSATFEEQLIRPNVDIGTPQPLRLSTAAIVAGRTHVPLHCTPYA